MNNKIYILVEGTYDYHEFLKNIGVDTDKERLIKRSKELSKLSYIDLDKLSDKAKIKLLREEHHHCYIEEWDINEINYKQLLSKYMDHIHDCEGSDYTYGLEEKDFTNKEIEELKNI